MNRPLLLAALAIAGCKGNSSTGAESHSSGAPTAGAGGSYGSKRATGGEGSNAAVGSSGEGSNGAGSSNGANANGAGANGAGANGATANGANGADGAGGSNATGANASGSKSAGASPGWAGAFTLVRGKASATSVAIDSKGNAIVAINFEHSIGVGSETFDGGEGGSLLIKVPVAGGPIAWTKQLGKDSAVDYVSVAVDSKDAIVLTATMRGTADVGGGALTSAGDKDILLAKFGADGKHQWSKRFGGRSPDRPTNVAVDAKDNIAIAGYYANDADFGGKKLTGKNSAEMFVARYTPDGKTVFANRISGGGEDQSELYGVAVDGKSNVIAIGAFSQKLDLGGKPLAGLAGKAIQTFVVAYTPAGGIAWSTAYAPGGMTMATVVRVGKTGNVILAGTDMNMPVDQNNMVSFDAASGAPTQGSMKSFVAALGPDHKPKWSIAIANSGMGDGVEPAITDSGEVLVVGNAASAPFGLSALNGTKHFFARISPAGVLVSAVSIPNAKEISVSAKLATRGATTVIAVQTGEGNNLGLTLLRPE